MPDAGSQLANEVRHWHESWRYLGSQPDLLGWDRAQA